MDAEGSHSGRHNRPGHRGIEALEVDRVGLIDPPAVEQVATGTDYLKAYQPEADAWYAAAEMAMWSGNRKAQMSSEPDVS